LSTTQNLIFGFHPVREALRHDPHRVERVLVCKGPSNRRRRELEELCQRHSVKLVQITEGELSRKVPGVHNGFAAELSDLALDDVESTSDVDLVVLLEDVQDPRNLGAILRVCEGAGVGRVLVRDKGSAPLSATVVKASAGASEWLDVERITNSGAEIERLKSQGFWVYGAHAEGRPAWDVDLSGKVVLCFGGEAKGLRSRTRELCDELVALPMRGRIESLNVSAAAAATLFEAVRQRSFAKRDETRDSRKKDGAPRS
jgi:23S rRNA (guanosine2251-2'-O)-methyltransferase